MWNSLKKLFVGTKSSTDVNTSQTMLGADERGEMISRKELPFIEEVKMIFGDYSQLFKCVCIMEMPVVVTDYEDDEGVKDMLVIGRDNIQDKVLVMFKGVMESGTFYADDIQEIVEVISSQVDYASAEYDEVNDAIDIIMGVQRIFDINDDTQAFMVMNTFSRAADDIKTYMPDIRCRYGRV